MNKLWERIRSQASKKKWVEWAGGLGMMLIAGLFSPTYWLMNLAIKPYLDLKAIFSAHNPLLAYLHLIQKMKALGPETLLCKILPLLCLCMLVSLTYSAFCTWLGIRLTKLYTRNTPQAA